MWLSQAVEEGVLRSGLWAFPCGSGSYTVSCSASAALHAACLAGVLGNTTWPCASFQQPCFFTAQALAREQATLPSWLWFD